MRSAFNATFSANAIMARSPGVSGASRASFMMAVTLAASNTFSASTLPWAKEHGPLCLGRRYRVNERHVVPPRQSADPTVAAPSDPDKRNAESLALFADRAGRQGPGMQDVDGPTHVEPLTLPAGARGSRVKLEAQRFVPRSQRPGGIVGHRWRRWDLG